MNSSLFDYFQKQLHNYYKFLSQYEITFQHIGSNEDDLTFSVSIFDPNIVSPTQSEINHMLRVISKISSFAKLFDIHLTNEEVCVSKHSIYQYESESK